jgi:hypothetical protein
MAAAFEAYTRQNEATEAKTAKHNRKIRRWTRVATTFAIAYTLVTGVILGASIRSVHEARRAVSVANRAADAATRQASIAEDTEKRQLRAYVVAASIGHLENFVPNGTLHATVTFENVGQTPVYSGKWKSGFGILPYPQSEEPTWPDCQSIIKEEGGFTSFFGRQTTPDKTASWQLTQGYIDRVNAKDRAIYFLGRFCYEDIFTVPHHTDFCFVWTGNGQGGLNEPDYCHKGNYGDRSPPLNLASP